LYMATISQNIVTPFNFCKRKLENLVSVLNLTLLVLGVKRLSICA